MHAVKAAHRAAPEAILMMALAARLTIHTYGSGQAMIGTELMLFFGLPSMTRSL
jgi:hypothetical protein